MTERQPSRAASRRHTGKLIEKRGISHQDDLLNLLRRLNREQGKTLVLVLHDLNQALEFADHLIYMKNGKTRAQGSPAHTATPELISDIFGLSCDIVPHPRAACPLLIPLAGVGA